MVQLLAAEFTDVNFQPHTMAQRDELYILQAEYNKFLTTTRYLIAGLDIWHTKYAMHHVLATLMRNHPLTDRSLGDMLF